MCWIGSMTHLNQGPACTRANRVPLEYLGAREQLRSRFYLFPSSCQTHAASDLEENAGIFDLIPFKIVFYTACSCPGY